MWCLVVWCITVWCVVTWRITMWIVAWFIVIWCVVVWCIVVWCLVIAFPVIRNSEDCLPTSFDNGPVALHGAWLNVLESNSQGFDQRRLLFMLWSISWCSFCFCSEFCCEHIPSGILASSVFRTVLLKYCGYEHGVSIEIVQPPLHSGLFRFQHYLRYRKDHVSMAIDAFSRKVRNLIVDAACAARFFSAG